MPENYLKDLLLQDVTWPIMVGMTIRAKDFVLSNALVITAIFGFGYAAHKLDNTNDRLEKLEQKWGSVEKIQIDVATMKTEIIHINKSITSYMQRPTPHKPIRTGG